MGRTISIARGRLPRWLDNFALRHPDPRAGQADDRVIVEAPDGARAVIEVPFPPLAADRAVLPTLIDHTAVDRRIGGLLVRKGGWAVGSFTGEKLITSKTGSGYVQGRTKAGGWSQQRYSRRRDNQAKRLYERAADGAAAVLLPVTDDLDAVAVGGDRAAIDAVLGDARLERLRPLVTARLHSCPDPRLRVLRAFADQFLAVRIELNDDA